MSKRFMTMPGGLDFRSFLGHIQPTTAVAVPEYLRISSSDLRTGELIGYGSSSVVQRATWLCCEVAVKKLIVTDLQSFKAYLKELEILMRIPHPHVVQLLGFNLEAEQSRVSLVMELMETNLGAVIHDRKRRLKTRAFEFCEAVDIATKIALGLGFLHSKDVVHGSLTPDIILMNVHAKGLFDIKIAGFAYSDSAINLPNPFSWNSGKAEDVYEFAIVCYTIFTRSGSIRNEISEAVASAELLPGIGGDLAELILECGDDDPERRPGISTVCDRLAKIRAACNQAPMKQTTRTRTEDCAGQWTTHADDDENKCVEIATMLSEILPTHLSIDPSDVEWREKRLIAKGGYNQIYEVNWLGCAFAVKKFEGLSLNFKDEVEFLRLLQHPHIARFMGISIDKNGGWIVMERMDMDLRKLIESRSQLSRKRGHASLPPFSDAEARELCLKIALGLNFLHSKNVAHRDIKAANVLVHDHHGRIDVKITDFGASHRIGNQRSVAHRAGTGVWRAPEVLRAERGELREEQLLKTDVYSFAMVCYEILTGKAPHELAKETDHGIESKRRPTLPKWLDADMAALISKCWDDDPQVRPSFSTICPQLASIPAFGISVSPLSKGHFCINPFSKCLGLRSAHALR